MKRVAILGSTGSIGRQTLDVIRQHPDLLHPVSLTALSNTDSLRKQAEEFGVRRVGVMDEAAAKAAGMPGGMGAVIDAATADDVDIVVVAVAGVIGLLPTLAAIESGKDIALASKEVLVSAGEIVMPLVREKGITLTPIDSEHSALFQCLQGADPYSVKSLVLTASGGPFRGKKLADLENVTQENALAHTTWNMGGTITVDSATLMNKGLEVIEARWLFNIDVDSIEVVVHPQSIIHSMVRFMDGSVLGQLGWPDMRLPIQYALLYPERVPNRLPDWDPVKTPNLTFESPDRETFRCLDLAYEAVRKGKTTPCALNAANEEAANGFLEGRCSFLDIPRIVETVMTQHLPVEPDLDLIIEVDRWAREAARELMA